LSTEETVTFNLELNVEQAISQIRRMETLLFRTLALINRLGLPEDISRAISVVQRLIMTVRMLHTAILAFEAATGPIGWALAGVGFISSMVSLGELGMELS